VRELYLLMSSLPAAVAALTAAAGALGLMLRWWLLAAAAAAAARGRAVDASDVLPKLEPMLDAREDDAEEPEGDRERDE
jgi:hypothetical protein